MREDTIHDAFVLGAKSDGVYAGVLKGEKLPAPSINISGSERCNNLRRSNRDKIYDRRNRPKIQYELKGVFCIPHLVLSGDVVRAVGYAVINLRPMCRKKVYK